MGDFSTIPHTTGRCSISVQNVTHFLFGVPVCSTDSHPAYEEIVVVLFSWGWCNFDQHWCPTQNGISSRFQQSLPFCITFTTFSIQVMVNSVPISSAGSVVRKTIFAKIGRLLLTLGV